MPVNIIDTLKPKNGGSFPIVEAIDVFVENYGNLAEAVSHFATDVMIEAINTVLSGKANTSDVNADIANLQAQINQIITPVTQDAEVQNARVGADGKSYTTLKERLDTEQEKQNDIIALHESINDNVYEIYSDTENIFDKRKILLNHAYKNEDGTLIENDTYSCTIKFKVKHGARCVRSSQEAYRIVIWNSDGTFSSAWNDKYAVFPQEGQYVAFMYTNAELNINTLMIAFTSETTGGDIDTWESIFGSAYIPYDEKYILKTENVDIPSVDALDALTQSINTSVNKLYVDKAAWVTLGKNKYNPADLMSGYAYKLVDGTLTENALYKCTPIIPIDDSAATDVYSTVPCHRFCLYDQSKNFISATDDVSNVLISGAKYVSVTYLIGADLTDLMICFVNPNEGIPAYEPFTNALDETNLVSPTAERSKEKLDIVQSEIGKMFIAGGGKNKFNPDEILLGYTYKEADGTISFNDSYKATPLIPIDNSEHPIIHSTVRAVKLTLYDAQKNFLRNEQNKFDITINAAKYVSCVYGIDEDLSQLMICYVDAVTDPVVYEPMKYAADETNLIIPSIEKNKPFSEILFSDLSAYIETDVDYQEMLTLEGTGSTKFWKTYREDIAPKTVLNLAFFAKTDTVDDGTFTQGAFIDIRFFDKNDAQIGTKYNMNVLSMNRFGYHKYQAIAPAGTKYYILRVVTRGTTTMQIKSIDLNKTTSMPIREDASIIYDCHLGPLLYAPKNTMSAYEMARIMGFKNLIINVKSTSDDVLVAIHDATIDATSDGTGNVSDYTYDELLEYDFGSWFSRYYTGERIPKVDDVLRFISTAGMNVIFSIHPTNTRTEIDALYELCKKYNLTKPMFKSYYHDQIEYIYSKFGDNAVYDYLITTALTEEDIAWINSFGKISYIEPMDYSLITAASVSEFKDFGCEVIWTITSSPLDVAKAIKMGVKRFTSDMCSDMIL